MNNKVLDKQNGNSKCVLFIRESTDAQELKSQRNDLIKMAESYGFDELHRIIIQEKGASAIKANEKYLKQLDNLKDTINSDDSIICVFFWEVSRLGRRMKFIADVKDFCINEKHIQMMVQKPSLMAMLNADGSINTSVSLAFDMMAAVACAEMGTSQARMIRGKKQAMADGKFGGGPVQYGWAKDSKGYIVRDEHQAEIVRELFDRYINTPISTYQLYKEMADRGEFQHFYNRSAGVNKILRILKDYTYCGMNKSGNRYPAIVSKEMVDAAIKKASENRKDAKREHRNLYFCKGIIVNAATGIVMCAQSNNIAYSATNVGHKFTVSVNVMDYVAWFNAAILKNVDMKKERETNRINYTNEIAKNEMIIASKEKEIENLKKKVQNALRTQLLMQDSEFFNADDMKEIIDDANNRMKALTNDITTLKQRNTQMQNLLNGIDNFESTINFADNDLDDVMKKQIIDSVIERIEVKEIGRGHRHFRVVNKIGYIDNSWYDYQVKNIQGGTKILLTRHFENGQIMDMTDAAAANKRFERRRYGKKKAQYEKNHSIL